MKTFNVLWLSCLFLFVGLGASSCSKGDNGAPDEEEPGVETDPVGTVYYENNFDAMVWGGNYITNEPGPRPAFKQDPNQNNLRVIDESVAPTESTPGTD